MESGILQAQLISILDSVVIVMNEEEVPETTGSNSSAVSAGSNNAQGISKSIFTSLHIILFLSVEERFSDSSISSGGTIIQCIDKLTLTVSSLAKTIEAHIVQQQKQNTAFTTALTEQNGRIEALMTLLLTKNM